MKRKLLWVAIVLFAASCKPKQTEVQPQTKMLTSAVYASGTLLPEQEYKVVSSVDGYLVKALVNEGDTIHNGQLLFKLNSDVRKAQQAGAGAMVRKTLPEVSDYGPNMMELEGQIEVAKIKKQQDSLQYVRYKNLFDQHAVSQSNYERYYLQYQSSLKDYQNLKQRRQQQRLAGNLQLQEVKNQLSLSAAQSEVGNLKSFMNGIIYEVYKKEGDLVMPDQPIALIGTANMYAKLLVDEDDLHKVFEGQKVLITVDAYPDKVFNAHISKIYPLLNKVEQSFRADAVIDEPLPAGMYGLNLEANIIVAEKKQVLAVPKAAVLKGDTVIVKENGKEKKVKILKGIEDDEYVEIKSGIDKSATVIIKQ